MAQDRAPLSYSRVPALDGLRGVAVALVFLVHIRPSLFPGAFLGVMLFFTLSGFLITTLLLEEWQRDGRVVLRAFYLRRLLRLMPALTAMVAATLVANIVLGQASGTTYRDAAAALFYVMDLFAPLTHTLGGGYNHTWSLAVEEQFYLLWPVILLLALVRGWRLWPIVVGGMVALTALTAALALTGAVDRDGMYRLPTTHFPEIGAGILLALVLSADGSLAEGLRRRWVGGVALLATTMLVLTTPHRVDWLYAGGFTLTGLAFAALIGNVVTDADSVLSRVLSTRRLCWLGRRSYGFYLWHAPILFVLRPRLGNWLVWAVSGLVLSLLATVVSWRVVETPFLRLKRRFERVGTGHDELARPSNDPYQRTAASS